MKVQFSSKDKSASKDNAFGQTVVVAFKRKSLGDDFSREVKSKLLPLMGTSADKVKKAVAGLINESKLMDIDDADVVDCTIIAEVDGNTKTIYMIEHGSLASQFPLSVTFNEDGHPDPLPTKKAMIAALETQIISRKEDA